MVDGLARRLRPRGRGGGRGRAGREAGPGAREAGGGAAFAVFNDVQDHLLRAARAHVDRVVLEAFVAGLERCPDPAARALLSRVCDLYVLATIEADLAWFLAHGRLTPTRAKSVTSAVNGLCQQLRPHAQTLVDGFAIPPQYLDAEMLRPA